MKLPATLVVSAVLITGTAPAMLPCTRGQALTSVAPTAADTVADPIKDFVAFNRREAHDSLFVLETDLDQDGKREVMLTFTHNTDGRAGNVWQAYLPAPGGYRRVDDLLSFDTRTLYIGHCPELLTEAGLIAYYPGGGGRGMLGGYTLKSGRFERIAPKEIEPAGKDKALFERYFSIPEKPKIKVLNPDQLGAMK